MTVSALATEVWPLAKTASGHNRFYRRPGKPQGFIVHHAATTHDSSLKAAFVSPARELSANYAMRRDGTIAAVLHEEYRPFTSASPRADNWGITIEIVNDSGAPGWEISDRAFDQLARLIADCATRWGFDINRATVIGHREVLRRFNQGYLTACPGGIWPRMEQLVALARHYAGKPAKPAPKPPVSKPAAPAAGSVVLGSTLRLSRWVGYRTSALTGRQRGLLSGDFEVIGISRGNYKVRGGGREAWVHGSARAGLVPSSPAAPKPSEPWRTPVNRTMRLAEARDAYRTAAAAKRRSPVWKRVPAGSYRITGASRGQFHIEGNGYDVWVSDGARSGVR